MAASKVIQERDCTMIDHFGRKYGLGLISRDNNWNSWTFGYTFTKKDFEKNKHCARYGPNIVGTRIGEENPPFGNIFPGAVRIVCACSGNQFPFKHNLR